MRSTQRATSPLDRRRPSFFAPWLTVLIEAHAPELGPGSKLQPNCRVSKHRPRGCIEQRAHPAKPPRFGSAAPSIDPYPLAPAQTPGARKTRDSPDEPSEPERNREFCDETFKSFRGSPQGQLRQSRGAGPLENPPENSLKFAVAIGSMHATGQAGSAGSSRPWAGVQRARFVSWLPPRLLLPPRGARNSTDCGAWPCF